MPRNRAALEKEFARTCISTDRQSDFRQISKYSRASFVSASAREREGGVGGSSSNFARLPRAFASARMSARTTLFRWAIKCETGSRSWLLRFSLQPALVVLSIHVNFDGSITLRQLWHADGTERISAAAETCRIRRARSKKKKKKTDRITNDVNHGREVTHVVGLYRESKRA